MLNKPIKHKWLASFIVISFLFLLVNLFLFPLLNSGDDVFLMYTLGGGYGEAPTNLLHYNYGWHPVLGWIVKSLFDIFPNVNWYSIFLMLLQATGCAVILYVLFHRFQWFIALILFMVFFFFFEIRILLSLNFSSTSWVLATAGFVLLLDGVHRDWRKINLFIVFFLLLLAGLLRLQILLAVVMLFFPCFFIYARKEYKKWVSVIVSVGVIIFLLNLQHQHFYSKHIPGWQKQEKIRQSLFYAYNRPGNKEKSWNEVFSDSTEQAFYRNHFFYDTTFISAARIEQIGKALVRNRNFKTTEDRRILYWLFIELRVYILLFIICFFLVWQKGVLKKIFRRWVFLAFFVFAAYGYLLLFLKITPTIHLGLIMFLWIYFIMALSEQRSALIYTAKRFPLTSLLLLLPFFWIGVRIMKKDRDNRQKHQLFQCVVPELINNSDKLFIATDDALPLDYFYIWDTPHEYRITNLIYKDRVLTHTYNPTLQRFGITDVMKSIYQNPNVFLLGREFPELKNYYKQKYKINIMTTPNQKGYKCLEVRKIYANRYKY